MAAYHAAKGPITWRRVVPIISGISGMFPPVFDFRLAGRIDVQYAVPSPALRMPNPYGLSAGNDFDSSRCSPASTLLLPKSEVNWSANYKKPGLRSRL
jgi:hypothetical protein